MQPVRGHRTCASSWHSKVGYLVTDRTDSSLLPFVGLLLCKSNSGHPWPLEVYSAVAPRDRQYSVRTWRVQLKSMTSRFSVLCTMYGWTCRTAGLAMLFAYLGQRFVPSTPCKSSFIPLVGVTKTVTCHSRSCHSGDGHCVRLLDRFEPLVSIYHTCIHTFTYSCWKHRRTP
jgi:hypothetical protein